MSKDMQELQEYLKTIGWTLFVAIIIVSISVIDLRINTSSKKITSEKLLIENNDDITDYLNPKLAIDELLYQEKTDGANYIINLKLAFLYELIKDYNGAEENYQKALLKSQNSAFSVYKSAIFYAKQKKYQKALAVSALFPQAKDKKIYEMKARFYDALASSFLSDKDYPNAVKIFKIAHKYARNTDKTLELKTAKDTAHSYSEYADKFISENNPVHAAQMLENALEFYPDPYAMYKLALVYQGVDNIKAQKYMERAYNAAPEIVNLDMYNKLLRDIVKEYNDTGEYSKASFYKLKQENFKRKLAGSNIFKDDIKIENFKIHKSGGFIFSRKKYYVIFDLKNNSSYPVDNLFIKIVIKPRGENIIETEKKIITRNNPIEPKKTAKSIAVPFESKETALGRYAEIQILAKKDIRAKWVVIDYLTASFTK